jgi:hypothetical protein
MEKIKVLLQFKEILEEYRDLSVQEWNFKAILNEKLSSLLDQQRIYWKQRANIKSIKFGDDSIKFFHANATIKFRKNSVAFLHNSNGELISEHSGRADLLWEAYKDRLGISELANIQLDLQNLLERSVDLQNLELPFAKEEIDQVVRLLPLDKSPGPDGFNTNFIKKYWHIIAPDFYRLMEAFFEGNLCLQSINGSFIALVHKKGNPLTASDFRPISLLNCSIKLITTILANRL